MVDRAELTTDSSATVIAVDGMQATIRIDEGGCGRCREPGGCGGHHLGQLLCPTSRTYRVANPEHCTIGQRVRVGVRAGSLGRSAFHVYVVPLLALLAGALGGSLLAGEPGAIIGALAGLLIGWLCLYRAQRRYWRDGRPQIWIRS